MCIGFKYNNFKKWILIIYRVLGFQILCLLSSYSSWTAALNTLCWPSDWHQHHPHSAGPSIFPRVTPYLISHLLSDVWPPCSQESSAPMSAIATAPPPSSVCAKPPVGAHAAPRSSGLTEPVQRRFLSTGTTENNRLSRKRRRERRNQEGRSQESRAGTKVRAPGSAGWGSAVRWEAGKAWQRVERGGRWPGPGQGRPRGSPSAARLPRTFRSRRHLGSHLRPAGERSRLDWMSSVTSAGKAGGVFHFTERQLLFTAAAAAGEKKKEKKNKKGRIK